MSLNRVWWARLDTYKTDSRSTLNRQVNPVPTDTNRAVKNVAEVNAQQHDPDLDHLPSQLKLSYQR